MAKLNIPNTEFEYDVIAGKEATAKKASEATAATMLMVDPDKIVEIPGFNVRVDTPEYLAHINTLADSIEANGFFPNKPLGGYYGKDGELMLTDGYSRLRAVRAVIERGVDIGKIPFVAKPAGQTIEDLTVALVQDNEGRPLSVFERAIVVKRLASYNMDNATIAKRLGVTDRYVGDLLVLAGAPAKVRNMVINGKVSATEAVKQLRKDAGKAAEKLSAAVAKAESEGKSSASGKDVKAVEGEATGKKSGVSMSAVTKGGKIHQNFTYRWKQGEIVPLDQIKPVRLLGGGDWWNFVDENTKEHVVIEEDVEIKVTMITTDSSPVSENAETPASQDDAQTPQDGGDEDGEDEDPPAAPAPALEQSEAPDGEDDEDEQPGEEDDEL